MTERKEGLAHCCHHDCHWEFCYDFDERVNYIKTHKPLDEQELRLKLFQLIPDDVLPGKDSLEWAAANKAGAAYYKAGAAYNKAGAAYYKADAAYYKAGAAHNKAGAAYIAKYQSEFEALHDRLFPNCPWDGTTIFP